MEKFVYICAAARSGSTMLDMLIGGHSKAASLGEFSFLGKAIALDQTCGCGTSVKECTEWNKVFETVLIEKGVDLLEKPYALRQWDTKASVVIDKSQQTFWYLLTAKFRSALCKFRFQRLTRFKLSFPSSLKRGVENTLYLYRIILTKWEKSIVIDSSKNINKALALADAAPESIKVILLVRDGRGVFHSRRSTGFSRKESLYGWKNYYENAFNLIEKNLKPDQYRIVRYEEVATNPEAVLRDLCKWIGVMYEDEMADLSSGVRHLVNGNDTRFKRDKGLKLDERWKTELDRDELTWFLKHSDGLNRQLGYE